MTAGLGSCIDISIFSTAADLCLYRNETEKISSFFGKTVVLSCKNCVEFIIAFFISIVYDRIVRCGTLKAMKKVLPGLFDK